MSIGQQIDPLTEADKRAMTAEDLPVEYHAAACPKCGHHFWHKVGHVLKVTGEVAEKLGLAYISGGMPGVPR